MYILIYTYYIENYIHILNIITGCFFSLIFHILYFYICFNGRFVVLSLTTRGRHSFCSSEDSSSCFVRH